MECLRPWFSVVPTFLHSTMGEKECDNEYYSLTSGHDYPWSVPTEPDSDVISPSVNSVKSFFVVNVVSQEQPISCACWGEPERAPH